MASGFVQRWKGKITAAEIYVQGISMFDTETPSTDSTLGAVRVSKIANSSGAGVYTVPRPTFGGQDRTLAITSVSSGAFFKAASGTSFGVMGTSTMTVMKSTVQMSIDLCALSTALWAVRSVWSTSTTVIPQPTFSTTT